MVKAKQSRFQDDIVDDVLRRIVEAQPTFPMQLAMKIAQQVRHDWAGDTSRICYIAKATDAMRSQRNDAIIRDHLAGERIGLLSRRYGLSERRVQQIIKSIE